MSIRSKIFFLVAMMFWATTARADVQVVLDPGPPLGATALVVGDFAEPASGPREHFRFDGTTKNPGATLVHLQVSARVGGAVVPGSTRSIAIPPGTSSSAITYDYTAPRSLEPTTVGLELECTDGGLSFVAGVFAAAPAAAFVPTSSPRSLLLLLGTLVAIGGILARTHVSAARTG